MRILEIYDLNPMESIGGIEVAIHELSKELVRLGHDVTILTGAGAANGSAVDQEIEVMDFDFLGSIRRTYSPGRLTLLRQFLFLSTVLARKLSLDYDVYHGHIYSSGLVANYLAKRHNGISVNTIHGSYYPAWDRLKNPFSAFFYKQAEKRLATFLSEKVHLQIHVSSYFADQVSDWGGTVKVIPNGVNDKVFHPGVSPRRDGSKPIILTARRLVKKNGVEYLIKAMSTIEEECRLVVIGDGPERHRLERLAKGAGNVEFLGKVSHKDMPGYIASADIAVVPSIIEASSLFMLEAMAMGKPVVASGVGGLPEALGDAGMLVPPMDSGGLSSALDEILKEPSRQRQLGANGKRRIKENYTWEKIAKTIEAEFDRLWSEIDA